MISKEMFKESLVGFYLIAELTKNKHQAFKTGRRQKK